MLRILVICCWCLWMLPVSSVTPFADCIDKPILPTHPVPDPMKFNEALHGVKKHIPQNMWIAVRDVNDTLPRHMPAFHKKNSNLTVTFQGNDEKDRWMETHFANTSTLWYVSVIFCCLDDNFMHFLDELWLIFNH